VAEERHEERPKSMASSASSNASGNRFHYVSYASMVGAMRALAAALVVVVDAVAGL